MATTPIRRHTALHPVSREHHDGLMLCFQLRKGVKEGIRISRMSAYLEWFAAEHLDPHFRYEEDVLIPLSGSDHPMSVQVRNEHVVLRSFFKRADWNEQLLLNFADLLDQHIRFEERVWFNFLQENCPESSLQTALEKHNHAPVCGAWSDPYWLEFKR